MHLTCATHCASSMFWVFARLLLQRSARSPTLSMARRHAEHNSAELSGWTPGCWCTALPLAHAHELRQLTKKGESSMLAAYGWVCGSPRMRAWGMQLCVVPVSMWQCLSGLCQLCCRQACMGEYACIVCLHVYAFSVAASALHDRFGGRCTAEHY